MKLGRDKGKEEGKRGAERDEKWAKERQIVNKEVECLT